MEKSNTLDIEYFKDMPIAVLQKYLYNIKYKSLKEMLNKIQDFIQLNEFDSLELLFSLINDEFNIVYLRESKSLFPMLLEVERNGKIYGNTNTMKFLQKHFNSIITNCKLFKKLIGTTKDNELKQALLKMVLDFEIELTEVQKIKDSIYELKFNLAFAK